MAICWHADPTQLVHDIRHIGHQLENEQQHKQLSAISISSTSSIGGQYITTPHRQSENIQLLFDRKEDDDDEDAYAVSVNASTEVFSTIKLLPQYTKRTIVQNA
ncbi:unnamed protein product [Adineta steineri]|uniref:Uncharacterized protein n=1 Tax=Adineta steineri TaxID=433720 RepID=A0A815Q7S5_9BILA|nr:unnamed protein product [Adineta steineri]CAF1458815.1 unnamed protein product [Adineta steineri]CAF4025411.1 unnamed protein product [Adineta steineri]CAF4067652.1 unnamed protein product [Adineta steineri]